MRSAMVYPINDDNIMVINHIKGIRKDIEIKYCVSDIIFRKSKLGYENGYTVVNDADVCNLIDDIDTLLILNAANEIQHDKAFSFVELALKAGKNVECCEKLKKCEERKVRSYIEEQKLICLYKNKYKADLEQQFCDFESIVVGVGSIADGLDSTTSVLKLYTGYVDAGYRVSVVAADVNLRVLGFYNIPSLVYDGIEEVCKIKTVNSFINKIEIEDKPDIVIIQYPDGLMKCSNLYPGNFGVYSYIVSLALSNSIDYFVMTIPDIDINILGKENFEEVCNLIKFRYNVGADAVVVDNKVVDDAKSIEEGSLVVKKTDKKNMYVANYHTSEDYIVIGKYDLEAWNKLVEHSIKLLSVQFEEF